MVKARQHSQFQPSDPEVLGCCIIGMAYFPNPPNPNDNNNNNNNNGGDSFNNKLSFFNTDTDPAVFPSSPTSTGKFRFPGFSTDSFGTSPFSSGAFGSSFNMGGQVPFLDLSGKTSRINSILPTSVGRKFKAPDPPRFQDIHGLNSGESPLSKSGYGNTVGPSQGSSLSRQFFKDNDVNLAGVGLTAEEIDIPRESSEEETSRRYHQDEEVDADPGYDGLIQGRAGETAGGEYQSDGSETGPNSGYQPDALESGPAQQYQPGDSLNTPDQQYQPGDSLNTPDQQYQPGDSLNTPGQQYQPGDSLNTPDQQYQPGDSSISLNTPDQQYQPGDSLNTPDQQYQPGDSQTVPGDSPAHRYQPGDSLNNPDEFYQPGNSLNTPDLPSQPGDSLNTPNQPYQPGESLNNLGQ